MFSSHRIRNSNNHRAALCSFLQSTVGFDDEDLQAIADMEHIAEIMPSYSADVILQQENKNATVKVMGIQPDDSSYTELNKPVVIEGRMPQAANECVVDHSQPVP